jgi:cyanophycin synthetase
MEIKELKVMRGPNYWSNYRKKLIVMKLDLGSSESFPTNTIDGFAERLEHCMPSLYSHRCSKGHAGGFFERVRTGTWLGHVVEHVALEMQTLAGMDCGYGRTRSAGEKGIYFVVFSYESEKAGLYAAKAAVKMVENLASDLYYNPADDIMEIKRLYNREKLGPSTQAIVDEALRRNIPVTRMDRGSLIMFGQGRNQRFTRATIADCTSNIAVDLAADKEKTKELLGNAYIPVPDGALVFDETELDEAIGDIGFPLAIKPLDGNHGRGVTTNIRTREAAVEAFNRARQISEDVIVEKFVMGIDYRFLLVNYKLVAVAKRIPAKVIGDDKSSISQLIDEANMDPERGEGHEKTLTRIKVDEITLSILQSKNYTLDTVLPIGEILYLKDTANISTGGTSRDVTDLVHPDNIFMAERVARLMNLDICGIDVIAEDINIPITKANGAVIEVNACPGLRMHTAPSKGFGRNIGAPIMDMLYPGNAESRIPLVAITGTNGKTTTTRLVAHMAKTAGRSVGYTTTDGIYIRNQLIYHGDCSGPGSAALILRDPIVDFAVLECARGGILRSGLGFDNCNISIITNVTNDHLGLNGINTIEELARVKEVVAQSTFENGVSILNADDDLVYDMARRLNCKVALFSMDSDNKRIKSHCNEGGAAAVVEDGYFVLMDGKWKTRIIKINEVPLTMSGTAVCMIKNILPAILAANASGFSKKCITAALQSFYPSPENTPGRMNEFQFRNFRVMVDYVHNEGGYAELKQYMATVKATRKTAIIAATGDRLEEDIRRIGTYAAEMFDNIIIRHDRDGRGRTNEHLTDLLLEGIRKADGSKPVKVISDEAQAIDFALKDAKAGEFIFLCADDTFTTIEMVRQAREKDNPEGQKASTQTSKINHGTKRNNTDNRGSRG